MYSNQRFEAASKRPESDPKVATGATICDTPESIERFRMIACLTGLKLESKGIRVHRGVSCLSVARHDYAIQARTAAAAYIKMREKMVAAGIISVEDKR